MSARSCASGLRDSRCRRSTRAASPPFLRRHAQRACAQRPHAHATHARCCAHAARPNALGHVVVDDQHERVDEAVRLCPLAAWMQKNLRVAAQCVFCVCAASVLRQDTAAARAARAVGYWAAARASQETRQRQHACEEQTRAAVRRCGALRRPPCAPLRRGAAAPWPPARPRRWCGGSCRRAPAWQQQRRAGAGAGAAPRRAAAHAARARMPRAARALLHTHAPHTLRAIIARAARE